MRNTIPNNRISTSTHRIISTSSSTNTRIISCVNSSTNNSINSKAKISSSTRTYPRTCIIYLHKHKHHRITCNNSSTTTSSTGSITATITKSNLGNANSQKALSSYINHKYCVLRCESVFCVYITHPRCTVLVSFAKDFYKKQKTKKMEHVGSSVSLVRYRTIPIPTTVSVACLPSYPSLCMEDCDARTH
jgi:hypothetical protein